MKLYIINPCQGRSTSNKGLAMAMKKRRKAKRRKAVSKRRSVKKYRRNPSGKGALKQALSKKNLINTASLTVGFIGGIKAQKFVNNMDFLIKYRRFTGIIPLLLGSFLGVRSRKEEIKAVGAGLALSGAYDLVTQNIPQIGLSPVEGVDLDDDTYEIEGTAIDVDGNTIDLDGENDIIVGDDDVDLVGDDMPYAMV